MSDTAIFLIGLGVTGLVGLYVALVAAAMAADPRTDDEDGVGGG